MVERILTAEESKRLRKRKEFIRKLIAHIFLTLGSIIMIAPLVWMISTSLKEEDAVFTYPPEWIPWNQRLRKAGEDLLKVAESLKVISSAQLGKPFFHKSIAKAYKRMVRLSNMIKISEDQDIKIGLRDVAVSLAEQRVKGKPIKNIGINLGEIAQKLAALRTKVAKRVEKLDREIKKYEGISTKLQGVIGSIDNLHERWAEITQDDIDATISTVDDAINLLTQLEGEELPIDFQKTLQILSKTKSVLSYISLPQVFPDELSVLKKELSSVLSSYTEKISPSLRKLYKRQGVLIQLDSQISEEAERIEELSKYILDVNFVASTISGLDRRMNRAISRLRGKYDSWIPKIEKMRQELDALSAEVLQKGGITDEIGRKINKLISHMKSYAYKMRRVPHLVWSNYKRALSAFPFVRNFFNSLFVATTVTLGVLLTSSLAAYAFARIDFPLRDQLFLGYLGTLMIPGAVTMIPVFILIKKIGWVNTYQALILPAMFTAYGTFLLRQFFLTIPKDLEDAAIIDGCSRFRIYWSIILPLSKPALATLATFTFLGSWNDFMWPLIVLNSKEMMTLPVALASFQGLYTTEWTLLMAAASMVLIPVIVVYVFNQRFFVRGIVLTGLKG